MKEGIFKGLLIFIIVALSICFVCFVTFSLFELNDVSKILIYNDNFDIVREFVGNIDILKHSSDSLKFICDGVEYYFYNVRYELVK